MSASKYFFRASATDFKKITSHPIAYWVSGDFRQSFVDTLSLKDVGEPRLGMATGNNDIYLRIWQEVSIYKVGIRLDSRLSAKESEKKMVRL